MRLDSRLRRAVPTLVRLSASGTSKEARRACSALPLDGPLRVAPQGWDGYPGLRFGTGSAGRGRIQLAVRRAFAAAGTSTLTTLDQMKTARSPELGRSPFWERSSRALPDPEMLPRRVRRVGPRQPPLSTKRTSSAESARGIYPAAVARQCAQRHTRCLVRTNRRCSRCSFGPPCSELSGGCATGRSFGCAKLSTCTTTGRCRGLFHRN